MQARHKWILTLLWAFSAAAVLPGQAQEPNAPPQPPGWRRLGEYGQALPADPPPSATLPASTLTLPAGSWITVRVDEPLSSDHNQPGDAFTATLAQPLVADGRVIARRGQMVGGVVASAEKAGRAKGTSRLGLEITELNLVDGRHIAVRTTLMERRGDTSVGRDAGAIGATTAVGAAIGAAADGGFGAGMGAIAGAAASTIGVLVTRGKATVVYPETPLTFRLEAPLTISTESSPEVFLPASQRDYEQPALYRRPSLRPPPPAYYPYYPYYSYYYPPFFYGPSFFFYSGPRFHYGRGFRRW